MDLFTIFGKYFWDIFHYEIKSYSLENKVTYVGTKIWEMWEKTIFDQIGI